MNGVRRFERLVSAARREIVPGRDVSGAVLAGIREARRRPSAAKPMLVFAAVYAVACAALILGAYWYAGIESDPMMSFFAMANEIAP